MIVCRWSAGRAIHNSVVELGAVRAKESRHRTLSEKKVETLSGWEDVDCAVAI